jgi:hypothetical protein
MDAIILAAGLDMRLRNAVGVILDGLDGTAQVVVEGAGGNAARVPVSFT